MRDLSARAFRLYGVSQPIAVISAIACLSGVITADAAIAPLSLGASAASIAGTNRVPAVETLVSVRRSQLKDEVSIVGEGLQLRDADGSVVLAARGFAAYSLGFDGAHWTIRDKASAQLVAVSAGRTLEGAGRMVRVDLQPQRTQFRLVGRMKSRAELVALVPFERYVAGVIGAELPKDWPLEVFKAQAVAARSFALAKMRSVSARLLEKKRGWLFEGTTADQVFDDGRSHDRAQEATRATAGVILVEHGQVVSANYHSDCGGQTDEPATVWGGGPKLGVVRDLGCPLNPRAKWRIVRSFQEIQQALQAKQLLPTRFQLASLQVTSRSAAGRALSVALVDALSGRSFLVTGERLREAVGFSELRSTLFEAKQVESQPGEIEFVGRGFGHGSGLCQWGARYLALAGKNYREILRHYYPNLELQ